MTTIQEAWKAYKNELNWRAKRIAEAYKIDTEYGHSTALHLLGEARQQLRIRMDSLLRCGLCH